MFEPSKLTAPDSMGFFYHPDIPGEEETDDVKALCEAIGFDATSVYMDSDAPELLEDWYIRDDRTAATRWHPTPPPGDNWVLVAKGDTDDGPCAMFVRPLITASPDR